MTERPEPCEVCGSVDGVAHTVAGWLCRDITACYGRRIQQSDGHSDIRECAGEPTEPSACEPEPAASELPTLDCPRCYPESLGGIGVIFQDARGGFECTKCDARFLIDRQPPLGYGGPGGRLAWWELHGGTLQRWGDALGGAAGAGLALDGGSVAFALLGLSLLLLLASTGFRAREVFRP